MIYKAKLTSNGTEMSFLIEGDHLLDAHVNAKLKYNAEYYTKYNTSPKEIKVLSCDELISEGIIKSICQVGLILSNYYVLVELVNGMLVDEIINISQAENLVKGDEVRLELKLVADKLGIKSIKL